MMEHIPFILAGSPQSVRTVQDVCSHSGHLMPRSHVIAKGQFMVSLGQRWHCPRTLSGMPGASRTRRQVMPVTAPAIAPCWLCAAVPPLFLHFGSSCAVQSDVCSERSFFLRSSHCRYTLSTRRFLSTRSLIAPSTLGRRYLALIQLEPSNDPACQIEPPSSPGSGCSRRLRHPLPGASWIVPARLSSYTAPATMPTSHVPASTGPVASACRLGPRACHRLALHIHAQS